MMLATMLLLPGGVITLVALVVVVLVARTPRGQQTVRALARRIPPRLQAPLRRAWALARGEKLFLPGAPSVHST